MKPINGQKQTTGSRTASALGTVFGVAAIVPN